MSRFGGGGECGKSLRKSFRHAAKLKYIYTPIIRYFSFSAAAVNKRRQCHKNRVGSSKEKTSPPCL